MKKLYTILPISILLIVFILTQCAHPVMPTGGPKDETPPQQVESIPPNYTTNFSSDRFTITFDEFINLQNPRKEIFISPPLEKFPQTRVKGKSVQVRFEEELQANSTYTVYFGNAIVDITEKNPTSNFEYVFSTGDEIDSLSVVGMVVDAFEKEPVENIMVMLYLNNNDTIQLDSLPLYVRPISTTRTNEDGTFRLNNLKDEPYKIFALQDNNANYIYDLPNESIAFLDSLVAPEYMFTLDTIYNDSTGEVSEIVQVPVSEVQRFYNLLLFKEIDSTQRILGERVEDQDRFIISFRYPPEDLQVNLIEPDTLVEDWYLMEPDKNGDTIQFWLHGLTTDTLILEVSEKFLAPDTVRLVFRTGFETKRELKRESQRSDLEVELRTGRGEPVDYFDPLPLKFSRPVSTFDTSRIILSDKTDTLDFTLEFEEPLKRYARINHPWKQENSYELFIPDSVFTDITGTSHDTIVLRFNTVGKSDYGLLDLTVNSEEGNHYIIQIYDEEGSLFNESLVKGDSVLSFPMIKPGSYEIKALLDKNKNGQWDTGNYSSNLQPEEVYFYPSALSVRANWEVKETFKLP